MTSIALLSSGLDSVVAFKKAYDDRGVDLGLTFDYGQKAASKEIEYARKVCDRFNVKHKVIELPWLREITATALVSEKIKVPEPGEEELDEIKGKALETAKQVWVPNRNGAMINIAASFADAYKLRWIVAGFNAEEGATFPDNTLEYVDAVNRSLKYSCSNEVAVYAPVIDLDKEHIIREGMRIGAPLDLSWSCYYSYERPCGKCESCMRRARAFRRAGVTDPATGGKSR